MLCRVDDYTKDNVKRRFVECSNGWLFDQFFWCTNFDDLSNNKNAKANSIFLFLSFGGLR